MILSFTMIGASIIAMALIPPYSMIGIAAPILAIVARMVQGFSLGGEIGSNTAFLLEAAPVEQRGLIVSWQGASQYGALMIGGAVGVILSKALPHAALDAYGWRIAFLLGAATLPFGLWLRHRLPETLHETESITAMPAADGSRWALARGHWRLILIGLVVLACATVGSYVLVYIGTYAQETLHMSATSGFVAETAGNLTSVLAVLIGGWQSDRIGRWRVNVGWNLFFLATIYPMFYWLSTARTEFALTAAVIVLSVGVAAASGSFYAALSESLPKTIRGAGFGTIYSFSIAAFGGTTQLVITWLIHVTGNPLAPAWYLTGAAAIAQIALMLLPESAPVRLVRRAAASSA
jgi:MFS family permease